MIDTHTHLFVEEFKDDLPEVIQRAKDAGVTKMFMPNIDDTSIDDLLRVCDEYKDCYPLIGFHPTSVGDDYETRLSYVYQRLVEQKDKFVGIGEVGLDFYWDTKYKEEQIKVFNEQIKWALDFNMPIIIHCREAFDDLYSILLQYKNTSLRGIVHSFTGTIDDANKMLEFKNFLLGINGVVTFKKSNLPEVLENVPLSKLVLETDSPYLSPVPYRGKRNETSFVVKVAEKLSSIYNVDLNEIVTKTDENALNLFKMS